jgi:hypothetical protein
MKCFARAAILASIAAATAADTTPPVLSLDLESMNTLHKNVCTARDSKTSAANPCNSATYSKSCPVFSTSDATDAKSCPEPHVSAYDHHDGAINEKVSKVIKLFLKSDPGVKYTVKNTVVKSIDYKQRGEFVISYDAEDYSGNKAETIVFAMIMNDHRSPTITPMTIPTYEACQAVDSKDASINARATRKVQTNLAVSSDLYDGDVSAKLVIETKAPKDSIWTTHAYGSSISVDTSQVGTHSVRYTGTDYASIFGAQNVDNSKTLTTTFTVQDTTKPDLFCKSAAGQTVNKLIGVDISTTTSLTGTEDECAAQCFKDQWSALPSAVNAAKPCVGWTRSASTSTCTFYTAGVAQRNIKVHKACAYTNNHECGAAFTDTGAVCTDMYDSYTLSMSGTVYNTVDPRVLVPVVASTVNQQTKGDYTVKYTCTSNNQLTATPVTRNVKVVDTIAPTLTIVQHQANSSGLVNHQTVFHSAGYAADMSSITDLQKATVGYNCNDQCMGDLTSAVTTTWHKDTCSGAATSFQTLVPGTYALKYSCSDSTNAAVSKCRTVINADSAIPIITITGADVMTLEASQTVPYTDAGATCSDAVDGAVNAAVITTGANFPANTTGTYSVVYSCKDSASNSAIAATRTVTVKDSTCPTCSVTGGATLTVEASFPYTDSGSSCADSLDGVIAGSSYSNGAALTTNAIVNVERTGTYTITYRVKDGAGNWNDGCTKSGVTPSYTTRTVIVVDTLKPVIAIGYGASHASMTVFHKSSASDTGVNGEANPADSKFMAFSASSNTGNAYFLGAAASAMTGLALIGYSFKKQKSVSIAVPV